MKAKFFRKGAAVLLAAALVTGCAPFSSIPGVTQAVSLTASAEETSVTVNSWNNLLSAIENNDNVVITLGSDLNAEENDSEIEIAQDKVVTIDLNGHSLDRGQGKGFVDSPDWKRVIKNEGDLTIKDSSESGNGKITGAWSHHIYSSDGSIINNGTMTIEGGKITGNYGGCGGIYNSGTLNLYGGEITGNYGISQGGIKNSGTINISGSPKVYDNYVRVDNVNSGKKSDILLSANDYYSLSALNVKGVLTEGAVLYFDDTVSGTLTNGYTTSGNTAAPSTYFKLNDDSTHIIAWNNAETEAFIKLNDNYSYNITGASLVLDGLIGVKFKFNLPADEKVDISFKWGSENQNTYSEPIYGDNDPELVYTTLYISAKELSDTIAYTIKEYKGENDSSLTAEVLASGTYCVKTDYLDKLSSQTEEVQQMAKAVANYGAAAQTLFNYNTEKLANAGLTYNKSGGITDIDTWVASYQPSEIPDYKEDETTKLSYYGSSMILNSKTVMRTYIRMSNPSDVDSYRVSYGNQFFYFSPIQYEEGSHYFYFDTDGISPDKLSTPVVIHIAAGSINQYNYFTNVKDVMTFTYSPMDYIYAAYKKGSDNTKAAAAALYYYAKEAETYANSVNS